MLNEILRKLPGRFVYADDLARETGIEKNEILAWAREAGIPLAHSIRRTGARKGSMLAQTTSRTLLLGVSLVSEKGAGDATPEEVRTITDLLADLAKAQERLRRQIVEAQDLCRQIEERKPKRAAAPRDESGFDLLADPDAAPAPPPPVVESKTAYPAPKGRIEVPETTTVFDVATLLRSHKTVAVDRYELTAKPMIGYRMGRRPRAVYRENTHGVTIASWLTKLDEANKMGWDHGEPESSVLPDLIITIDRS